jgi:hypothetical protein
VANKPPVFPSLSKKDEKEESALPATANWYIIIFK